MKAKDPANRFTPERIEAAENEIHEQAKRIEFYLTEFSLELLASKMENGDFEIPDYQREFTWEPKRQSRFIESVLMGLPIPFLFFWENPKSGKLEIVDGSQRLRTIKEFLLGDMSLGELEELPALKGFRFSDLPKSRQRKVQNRSIRGIVLNEYADEQARFTLFDRINTGSKIANMAEVRRGVLAGKFSDLVNSLAKEPLFTSLAPVTPKKRKEREREELITRFFAYSDGLDEYRDYVGRFNFNYTRKMNARFEDPATVTAYRQRFLETMEFVHRNFPLGFKKTKKATETPRSRFEAIAIGSFLALQQCPALKKENVQVEEWLESSEFKQVTGSDGANARKKLERRIHFVRDRLLGAKGHG